MEPAPSGVRTDVPGDDGLPMDDEPEAEPDETPRIDLSAALGEAGHEVEELGYEGIPDDGPLVGPPPHPEHDADDVAEIALIEFPSD
jgi:hypothetical protein